MNENKLIIEDYSEELKNEETIIEDKFLTKNEKTCIQLLLEEEIETFKNICLENKISFEIVLDNLNEKFYDFIEDNIIDTSSETPYIYEDYIEEVKKIMEEN